MERAEKALEVDRRLAEAFGMRLPAERRGVTLELVHAVLSQNTHRRNYNLAYDRLVERFPTPDGLAAAPVAAVERAIRPGGLSNQKSRAIIGILAAIREETGGYSLEFLAGVPVEEARRFLTSLPGVGPKTASVVLMFALGRKVLPVDTHVLRTAKRLGLIDAGVTAERAERELELIVPPPRRPRMHLNLVELGREVCHARNPEHHVCPVNMLCESAAAPPGR